MEMNTIDELLSYLKPSTRLDVKVIAIAHILSLTGSKDSINTLLTHEDMVRALFELTSDRSLKIAKDAILCLINITADAEKAEKIYREAGELKPPFHLIKEAVRCIVDEENELADPWCMVVSNLTRVETLVHEIMEELDRDEETISKLVKAFTNLDYNKKLAKLHYLGPFFCNLTQTSRGREIFCLPKYDLMYKILPFTSFPGSLIRRGGTVGILKNLSFDPVYHNIILNEEDGKDEIISAVLYPLCGPEEFDDEENDKFPLALQYLPETKKRESDPDLRKMLLESLLQLSATRRSRELLRAKGVYEILREYHKWEARDGGDRECLLACENVVDILIKTEDEIGLDNYKDVEVQSDMSEKFKKEDAEYLQDQS